MLELAVKEKIEERKENSFFGIPNDLSDKLKCFYQLDHHIHGGKEVSSGDCDVCKKDKEHNPKCPDFIPVVPLDNLIIRFGNSPVIYCPLYDRDVKIHEVCYGVLKEPCEYFAGFFCSSEFGEGVLCKLRRQI